MSVHEHGFTRDEDVERKKKAEEAEKMVRPQPLCFLG